MKLQNCYSRGANLCDAAKLSNPDRVANFLREAKQFLSIGDDATFLIRGSVLEPGSNHVAGQLLGIIADEATTIVISTETALTLLEIKVYFDDLPQEKLDEVWNIAMRIFH